MSQINPKAELLVFNRKEIFVIVVLLVLVALFSFTLGLKMGRTLGGAQSKSAEPAANVAPLAEPTHGSEAKTDSSRLLEAGKPAEGTESAAPSGKIAEDKADKTFEREADKENLGVAKPVPMKLPKEKKPEATTPASGRFTLQVGAYRTVGEAADMVGELKKKNLDAFYLEAKIPGKGTWYRVGLGLYQTKEQAEAAGAKLKHLKEVPQFIIQKLGE